MAHYNEQFLLQAAAEFNRQADLILWTCILRYGFNALVLGFGGVYAIAKFYLTDLAPIAVYGSIAAVFTCGIIWGISRGRTLAFRLRVEAQKLLALVQIEHNTKHVAIPVEVS